MKLYQKVIRTEIVIWAGWAVFSLAGMIPASQAGDLRLEGSLKSGTYVSDEGIVISNNGVVDSGANVVAAAAFETILRPGTRVRAGGRLMIRSRDYDGLSNRCELLYFGHFNYSPQDDPDIDWLDNYAECSLGTNPNIYDMDNDDDGLPDWWEVKYFGYTLKNAPEQDSDGDGVANYIELQFNSNPAVRDLPGSGLHYEYDALGRIKQIYRIPAK